jgi:uronate dehydrogenase
MTSAQCILVTGAAGNIGTMLRARLAQPGRMLRLLDIESLTPAESEESIRGSITDASLMDKACEDVDAVIHLGARSAEAPWDDILEDNIHGTFTVFEAARRQRVDRIIFASSNHAVGFYPRKKAPVPDYQFPMPDTYYGVSKVAGEALGALYHYRYGLNVVCIRILSCVERPTDLRMLSTWLSPDDAGRLFEVCLSAENPGYRVIWGTSGNTRGWVSLEEARSLGYEPEDNAERYAAELITKQGEPVVTQLPHSFLGGWYCSPDYDVDKLA